MKEQLLTLVAFAVITVSCSKSKNNPEDKDQKLTEIVATITPYKFGKPSPSNKFTWSRTKFDDSGNIIYLSKRTGVDVFDGSKSYEEPTHYKYQDDKLIEKEDNTYRYTYTYAGQDTLEIRQYGSSGLYETRKYEYNQNKVKSIKFYHSNNEIFSLHSYKYNNAGLASTIHIFYTPFDGGDQLQYTYDGKGNVLTEFYINHDMGTTTVQKQFAYQYDVSGRIIDYTYNWGYFSFRKFKNYYGNDGRIEKADVFTGDDIDGSFEQAGTISYEYRFSQ